MYEERYKIIGGKIKYYRKLRGLTQEQLGEKVGITAKYLSRIECGQYHQSVSLPTFMRIIEMLEIKLSKFFEDID